MRQGTIPLTMVRGSGYWSRRRASDSRNGDPWALVVEISYERKNFIIDEMLQQNRGPEGRSPEGIRWRGSDQFAVRLQD